MAGTPYDGFGALGYLGAGANWALGGYPQRIGEGLGGWLYDAMH